MDRPKTCTIQINWIDENGDEHNHKYNESNLEQVYDLIGLMIGEITEEDLKP